ncbi:hypothetical protein AYO44_11885 [Planctomycetaceae bacterium SCGC AG-212-F19]|nr:hypothetical protein AYO44_11885 [Planctomycetaceae bacterium SCGC AG-212-F19]
MARLCIAALLVLGCGLLAEAQGLKFTRYNIDYDSNSFRQDTPKETLASVIQTLNDRRVDYLLAQLTDPDFVDEQVTRVYGGKFDELVKTVKNKFANDPELLKNLVKFSKEGEWEIGDTAASAKVPEIKDKIFFRKLQSRWFFENKKSATDKPAEKDEKKDDKKDDKKEEKKG